MRFMCVADCWIKPECERAYLSIWPCNFLNWVTLLEAHLTLGSLEKIVIDGGSGA